MPERKDVNFPSGGELCAGWYLRAEGEELATDAGRPCVVMAHGVGGTRDSGLLPYAQEFAGAGLDVLLFDYRCFGASSGEPRQWGDPRRHREDYRAAVKYARGLDRVDPERVVLWGTSWSGGHVVYVAAEDPRIAAVIAQTPDLDGIRTLAWLGRQGDPRATLGGMRAAIADAIAGARGEAPRMIPLAARPGEVAAMSTEDALPGYEAIAGPSWRNEITARAVLLEARNRPITRISELSCPILIQVAERDSIAPPGAAEAAAWRAKGRSEMHTYPCAHFDIYLGEWRERAVADQVRFLRRHLAPREAAPARAARGPQAATEA